MRWLHSVFLALAIVGCESETVERPPLAGEDCGGKPCSTPGTGPIIAEPGVPDSDMSSDAGATRDASADAAVAAALNGTVQIVTEPDFSALTPLAGIEVRVSAESSLGGRTSIDYAGDGNFSLPSPARSQALWVGVEQLSGAQVLLNTLQLVDARDLTPVDLIIADRSNLEEVASAGALSVPVELDLTRAHAVLSFADEAGDPLADVALEAPNGATLAYDAGNTFSDALEETAQRGSVLMLNASASAYPGSTQSLVVRYQGRATNISVNLAADTVTIATFKL